MILRLMPAAARGHRRGRFLAPVLLLLLTLGGAPRLAAAEDPDPFSATVAVDATAETVAKARDAARIDGQRRALTAIIEKLSAGGNTPARLPKLDDKAITDLVTSFEVANERMSAVRYAADYTFHFRPAEIRRLAGNVGATVTAGAEDPGKPKVLLPLYQTGTQVRLWEEPNPWRIAWDQHPPPNDKLRLVVPLGDAGDLAAIDAEKARAGDAAALTAIARRNGSEEALVALATTHGPADKPTDVEVTVRRYRAGQLADTHTESVAANAGESGDALLTRAVAVIGSDIAGGWKKEAAPRDQPRYDQMGSLTAILPISGLDDWVRARAQIAGVSSVRKVTVVSLSRQEATIEIGYMGNIDQLQAALAGASLDLKPGEPLWRLNRAGAGRTQ
jgi:hypothetical protein